MSQTYAPIALFLYNRADHALRTIESLKENSLASQSELFVFCDGPKNAEDLKKTTEVVKLAKNISGFKNVTVKSSESNHGLANSIIAGVSEIVEKFGRIIVLEDDMVTSPFFLKFMNDGLDLYESDERAISIHGYIYPVKKELPQTFFLQGADCWGWATWKRGWDLFEKDGSKLLAELEKKNLTKVFDFDGTYDYTRMLQDQISGKNNSWAIRWYASAFLADKLTLYPGRSLLQNIGIDGSGTHCGATSDFDIQINRKQLDLVKIPVEENNLAREAVKDFFKPKKNLFEKIAHKIRKKIKKRQAKKLGINL